MLSNSTTSQVGRTLFNSPIDLTDTLGAWPQGLPGKTRGEKEIAKELTKDFKDLTKDQITDLSKDIASQLSKKDIDQFKSVFDQVMDYITALVVWKAKKLIPFIKCPPRPTPKFPTSIQQLSPAQLEYVEKFLLRLPGKDQDAVHKILRVIGGSPV